MHVEATNFVLYIARSQGLFKLGQYSQALIDLTSAKQLFEEYTVLEEKRLKDNQALKGTTKTPPSHVYATIAYRRGVTNFQLKNWKQAIEDFSECTKVFEAFAPAYSRKGAALLKINQGSEAIQELRSAVAKATSNQHFHHYRLGQAYLDVGYNQLAVDSFTNAIDASLNVLKDIKRQKQGGAHAGPEVIHVSGVRYELFKFEVPDQMDVNEENISDRDQMRVQFPEFTAARGKAKALLGKFSEALADFEESSKMDQNNAQTYFEKSTANRIMGNYDDALNDIEVCATLKLSSDIAYSKATILENSGHIDKALELYEAVLSGVYNETFTVDYLKSRTGSTIDAVMKDESRKLKKTDQVVNYKHLTSLYHCALLHRQKMNFDRAIALIDVAISIDERDERYYDLKAMLHYDSNDYEGSVQAATKSIEWQTKRYNGANWDSFYIRALAFIKQFKFNHALADLVSAQGRPAGGQEKDMKKTEFDKVATILMKLPPGTPLTVAYKNAKNIEAIPRDPLSPGSAARGINGKNNVFPILDLKGSIPGYHNQYVLLRKAECLFELKDYIGCTRTLSVALEDFEWKDFVEKGKRKISSLFELIRANKNVRIDGAINQEGAQLEYAIEQMYKTVVVDITYEEREHIKALYFLRGRALSMLGRFPHAVKDCQRAFDVFQGSYDSDSKDEEKGIVMGAGSLLFFLSKLYAYLRLYTKCYHCARDSLKSGVAFNFIHRAHYIQGTALTYTSRLELAVKCYSLALRSYFQARVSEHIHVKQQLFGVVEMYPMEQIAAFLENNPEAVTELRLKLPSGDSHGMDTDQKKIQSDIHRLAVPRSFPTEAELAANKKLEAQRMRCLEETFEVSSLNQLQFKTEPFNEYVLLSNRQPKISMLQKISSPLAWTTHETVFYLHERAKALQELGLHAPACDDFTVVLQFQPRNDRAYFRRGFSLKSLGLFEQAVADFERARVLRPDLQQYQIGYGEVGKVEFMELVPPGNEERYTEAIVVERQGELSKIYNEAARPMNDVVPKRERTYGHVGFTDDDIWAVVGEFAPQQEEQK